MPGWTTNDLEPPLSGTALSGTIPANLSLALSVVAHVQRADTTTFSRAVVLGNQTTAPGTWTLPWAAGDLSVSGGYMVSVVVTWGTGRPQTFGPARFPVGSAIP